jgi:dTDP-4-amino-4,6-dideoxygalactose transaminase
VYYPTPIHRLRPYADTGPWDLTESERAAAEVLSLPIYPSLTPGELDRVVDAVNALDPS